MTIRFVLSWVSVIGLLFLASCRGMGSQEPARPSLATLTLVLVSEPGGSEPGDAFGAREIFEGHRQFLEAEAESGRLLVTGPFAPGAGGLRGLLIFDVEAPNEVETILARDPAVAAGRLHPEVWPLITVGALRQLPELEQARVTASGDRGGDSRPYVVWMSEDGASALELLQHPAVAPSVLLLGQLGAPSPGGLFAVLDLKSSRELSARIRVAGAAEPNGGSGAQVHEWYSTPALESLSLWADAPQPPRSSASK